MNLVKNCPTKGIAIMKKFFFILTTALMLLSNTVFAADAETILNSAKLTPTWTVSKDCNNVIHATLEQITSNSMTTYEKVKACYDYLIENCAYWGTADAKKVTPFKINTPKFNDVRKGGYGVENAYDMLIKRVGVCDDYYCAFAALVRAIGLNCYTISGKTARATGGMTGHVWTVININGTEYVFDPQIDDNISKGGPIYYYRFCKTYDEVPESYANYKIYKNYFVPFVK